MYTYNATLDRVIDGDTVLLSVDLGFDVVIHEIVRLARIDAPERFTDAGKLVTARVLELLTARHLRLSTTSYDKYRRSIGEILILNANDWRNLSDILLEEHLAIPYLPASPKA